MKMVMASVALGAILAGGTASAAIRAIDGLGNLYNIDTVTAAATIIGSVPDTVAGVGRAVRSPNSIGFGLGGNYYTSYGLAPNGDTDTEHLYRDGVKILDITVSGSGNFSIEAGDAVGDKFYFVDRDGAFTTVKNISTAPVVESSKKLFEGSILGDLAIRGSTAYISYRDESADNPKTRFASFDITAANPTLTNEVVERRYVGLAFDPTYTSLFGIQRVALGGELQGFRLWQIDPDTGEGTTIGDIAGLAAGAEFTDAATIPLPAAAWLLITAVGGLFGARLLRREVAGA